MDDLLTMMEAAKDANVHQASIYLAVSEGRLPCVERYGKKLIRPSDLAIYKERIGMRNGHKAKIGEVPAKRRRKKSA